MDIKELCIEGFMYLKSKVNEDEKHLAESIRLKNELLNDFPNDSLIKEYDDDIKLWNEFLIKDKQRLNEAEVLLNSL